MATIYDFVSVKFYLPGWPVNIRGYPEQLDAVGVSNLTSYSNTLTQANASGSIMILTEIVFDLPLIQGLSISLLNHDGITEFEFTLDMHNGRVDLILFELTAAFRIQTDLLKRMEPTSNGFIEAPPDPITGEPLPVEVILDGVDLMFNADGEFSFLKDRPS